MDAKTELEIVTWEPGRLALTGILHRDKIPVLRDKLQAVCRISFEHWRGDYFTFSFPERHRRDVIRLVEGLECS